MILNGVFCSIDPKTPNTRCADPTLYSTVEFKQVENYQINGINLVHLSAILNMTPSSVHKRTVGKSGYKNIYVSEQGSKEQVDVYVYSGDAGLISFYFESPGIITQEDQARIDELFRGFSFDGSACRGPSKLRALKTMFEVVTNQ